MRTNVTPTCMHTNKAVYLNEVRWESEMYLILWPIKTGNIQHFINEMTTDILIWLRN